MSPTTPTVDLSDRDNKETLFVKEEVTDDAEVFGEVVVVLVVVVVVVVDVGRAGGSRDHTAKEPSSSVLLLCQKFILNTLPAITITIRLATSATIN